MDFEQDSRAEEGVECQDDSRYNRTPSRVLRGSNQPFRFLLPKERFFGHVVTTFIRAWVGGVFELICRQLIDQRSQIPKPMMQFAISKLKAMQKPVSQPSQS